jgi:hypothetical protein
MEPKSSPSPRGQKVTDVDELSSPSSLLRRREAYFGRPPTPSEANRSRVASPSGSQVVSGHTNRVASTGSTTQPTADLPQAPSTGTDNNLQATANRFQPTAGPSQLRAEAPEFFPLSRPIVPFADRETWLQAQARLMSEARTYAMLELSSGYYAEHTVEPIRGGIVMAPPQATEGPRRKDRWRNRDKDFKAPTRPRWRNGRSGRGNGRGSGGAGAVGMRGGW